MSQRPAPVELAGLRVTIDRLLYRRLNPPQGGNAHSFIYFISIHNGSDVSVTIKGRKWIVTHDDGEVLVLEGDGVVGKTPTIPPGGKFTYNSQHLIRTQTATAEGAYLGVDQNGRRVVTRIPKFRMAVPGGQSSPPSGETSV